ncbi:MAG: 50S ribosomal protein L6 [Candidatus Moraniibacteriota bacterium]|nr:MAG: 50S ribosomal protein L6 [Candidatus Moranbacteria bacterium]
MSKIGRAPITIPASVKVMLDGNVVNVEGPKGKLSFSVPSGIKVEQADNILTITRQTDEKNHRALHGVTRATIANMVKGVESGFTKILELVGTGYRARMQGTTLILSLGYSHEIEYVPVSGITIAVENTNIIKVSGIDLQLVGEVAAKIRQFRKPEPYKGKGVRYQGEIVRKKAGKAAKAAGSA